MKRCPKCQETKPAAMFYRNQSQSDGLSSYCRPCAKQYNSRRFMDPETLEKRRAWMRAWCKKPRQRERAQKWKDEHREHVRAQERKYRRERAMRGQTKAYRRTPRHKLMMGAAMMVRGALGLGLLTRQSCVMCGAPESHAHHEDYSKVFEVTWLCRTCHARHHGRLRARGDIVSSRPITTGS